MGIGAQVTCTRCTGAGAALGCRALHTSASPGLSTVPESCAVDWTEKGHFPSATLRKKGWRVNMHTF